MTALYRDVIHTNFAYLHGSLSSFLRLLEHVLYLPRPPDLVTSEADHSLVHLHPLNPT